MLNVGDTIAVWICVRCNHIRTVEPKSLLKHQRTIIPNNPSDRSMWGRAPHGRKYETCGPFQKRIARLVATTGGSDEKQQHSASTEGSVEGGHRPTE